MNYLTLPTALRIGGKEYPIRSDFRVGIRLMQMFEDPELEPNEKMLIATKAIFAEQIPIEHMEEAMKGAMCFLDGGGGADEEVGKFKASRRLYSWKQDIRFILAAVDKSIGFSVRGQEYLHWWDFLSAFGEVGESAFSTIVNQRLLKQKGQQSDADREWWAENLEIAELKVERSADERAAIAKFNNLLKEGGV